MPAITQWGRPVSVAITVGQTSKTITDVVALDVVPKAEIHKHYGNARFPQVVLGNDASTLSFTTTDNSLPTVLTQGQSVTNVTATWAATATSIAVGAIVTDGAAAWKYTCTAMVVDECKPTFSVDGKPAEWAYTLSPVTASGSGPTITWVTSS
jgi:hypothetical protein